MEIFQTYLLFNSHNFRKLLDQRMITDIKYFRFLFLK